MLPSKCVEPFVPVKYVTLTHVTFINRDVVFIKYKFCTCQWMTILNNYLALIALPTFTKLISPN